MQAPLKEARVDGHVAVPLAVPLLWKNHVPNKGGGPYEAFARAPQGEASVFLTWGRQQEVGQVPVRGTRQGDGVPQREPWAPGVNALMSAHDATAPLIAPPR